jgi:hypothetical protein
MLKKTTVATESRLQHALPGMEFRKEALFRRTTVEHPAGQVLGANSPSEQLCPHSLHKPKTAAATKTKGFFSGSPC